MGTIGLTTGILYVRFVSDAGLNSVYGSLRN